MVDEFACFATGRVLSDVALTRINAQQECGKVYLLRETMSKSKYIIFIDQQSFITKKSVWKVEMRRNP